MNTLNRTRIPFVIIFTLVTFPGVAQLASLKNKIPEAADNISEKVIAWRRDFHEHPELSNRETRTSKIIANFLQSLGLEVKTGVAKTGVVGILKGGKPGPVIALRADMDALPVKERGNLPFASKVTTNYNGQEVSVMHACGHDGHMAILMGAAEILTSMKKDLHGTIKFIFQPAEEGAPFGEEGGAELMVKEGVLDNPKVEAIFGLHMSPRLETGNVSYRPGGIMASINDLQIIVKGKSAHGAYPWLSVDPIVTAAQIINNLQTIVSRNLDVTKNAGVVTIGSIHGGNRSNIIPEQVEMLGTIRALSNEDQKMLTARVREVAIKTAESAGAVAEVKIPYSSSNPITFNDSLLMDKMLPTLVRTAGKNNVHLQPAVTGAEDFSFYQEKIPGLFLFLGAMPKDKNPADAAPLHTPDFYIDERSFNTGVRLMCNLVLDYMSTGK